MERRAGMQERCEKVPEMMDAGIRKTGEIRTLDHPQKCGGAKMEETVRFGMVPDRNVRPMVALLPEKKGNMISINKRLQP